MEVLIRLDREEPPAGTMQVGGDSAVPAVPFVGWLGLLRALAELIGQASRPQAR